jgi:serine/threonine-protein phosphatase 2A regulatory subunit A
MPEANEALSLQRLAGGEWFTTRISCCGLLPTAYRVSAESQHEDLRSLFRVLSQDDTPMVRRAAAQSLGGIAEVVEPHALSQDICPIFLKLTQDGRHTKPSLADVLRMLTPLAFSEALSVWGADQDSVRLLAVQCCGPLARTLSKAECLATVVPVVQKFAQVGGQARPVFLNCRK